MPRVRSANPILAALIRKAILRSETFRRLVAEIDASDGLVYVQEGRCGRGFRACLPFSVTMAGTSRLLRVIVDLRSPDWDLMGSIGHELQHAIEVLNDASVTSNGAIYFFFKRVGTSSGDGFETNAALDAGDRVRAEARKNRRSVREAAPGEQLTALEPGTAPGRPICCSWSASAGVETPGEMDRRRTSTISQ
jgi:hypothetical protein